MNTRTALRKRVTSTASARGVKAVAGEAGVFEAIVSVFGNVDYQGDRIIPGAFAASLDRWKSSGDPIPVVFSHQWDNPEAHVGEVVDAKELLPGDPALVGTGLEENGGLWAKFALYVDDPDEAAARRLAKRLDRRTIREFSFAYDVMDERRASDGANELLELDVLEVGPTLKGANPATRLLSAAGIDDDDEKAIANLERVLFAGRKALADGEKASVAVTFEGSVEGEIEALFLAGQAWASDLDAGAGGFYALHQEASYPDELRAIVMVEGWEDPYGEGVFYELSFDRDDDGALSVADAQEIEIAVEVVKKARSAKFRAAGRTLNPIPQGKTNGDQTDSLSGGKAQVTKSTAEEEEGEIDETETAEVLDLLARSELDLL